MNKKETRTRLGLLIVLVLLLLALLGVAAGKYTTTMKRPGTVRFTVDMADSLVVQEHQAQKQADGTYKLLTGTTTQNSYLLIPGLDIPKDPHVVITGKTKVPAHLYLTVEDGTTDEITFSLRDHWVRTDPQTNTYTYYDGGQPAVITADQTVYILKDNTVYISQYLRNSTVQNIPLKFTAYLKEVIN